MISKRDITKIAKRVLKRQSGLRDHQIIHPTREWFTGLLAGAILLAGGATWSVWTYENVSDKGVEDAEAQEAEQIIYRDDMVNTALETLRERQEIYQGIIDTKKAQQVTVIEEVEEDSDEGEIDEAPVAVVPDVEESTDVSDTVELE